MAETQFGFSRRAKSVAFALAASASLAISAFPSQAADFTKDQCTTILGVSLGTVERLGPSTLSSEFRSSLKAFLFNQDRKLTCSTPKDMDIDAFNTIQDFLEAGPKPINLKAAGVRSVDPSAVASNPAMPGPSKRTELQAPVVR